MRIWSFHPFWRVRRTVVVAVTMAMAVATVAILSYNGTALADNIVNDVVVGGNDTFTAGGSTGVSYRINAQNNDLQSGCNAADSSPATLTIHAPGAVTAKWEDTGTASTVFAACQSYKPATLSAATAGDYAITVTISDSGPGTYSNNAAFTLHVKPAADTTPPVLTLPPDQTAEASGPSGVAVGYTATAFDAGDNAATPVTCGPASGSTFPLGTTTVTCSSKDSKGNTATGSFKVTVQDTTPPALSLSDQTAEATGPGGAAVSLTATAADLVDGPRPVSCSPASGGTFPIGTTTVHCSSSDTRGNTATGSLTVTVRDTTAPTLTLTDQTVEATSPDGAAVTYAASAHDTVDGTVAVSCDQPSGATFPLGTTTVHCAASDTAGNKETGSFTISVGDHTAPALTLSDTTAEATGPDGADVAYAASAKDVVDGDVPVACTPGAGSTFAVGATTVDCSASDSRGNTAMGNLTVTVQDTTPPQLTLTDEVDEATGPNGAAVTYAASASDLVDGAVPVSCDKPTGATFPLGATTVTCSAADKHGNKRSGSFTVTVRDTTAPELTLANQHEEATGPNGAPVSFPASAKDLVDGDLPATCSAHSGATFPLGDTTVTCSATDRAGNKATDAFTVTVADTTPPALALADTTVEATGPDGAVVTYTATAKDLVDGDVPVTCTPASGSTFALGTTAVNCSAADSRHNFTQDSFDVLVTDTTPPALTLTDQTVEATSPDGATVSYAASASDLVSGTRPVSCDKPSGSGFPIGVTTVACSATDAAGNKADGTFTVTVGDHTAPSLRLTDTEAEATGPDGAKVDYDASATDVVDGPRPVACTPPSGSLFALGDTTVKCSASDIRGNTATGSLTVTVKDTTAPTLTLHNKTAEATGPKGAPVAYSASASDLVDGTVPVSCDKPSGATFPLGTTTVTCTATDKHGNLATDSFTVTVVDTTAPVLSVKDQTVEATSASGATVSYTATATDLVDGAVAVTCSPASGSTFKLGVTDVTCTAADAHGNTDTATFHITVVDTTAPKLTVPADITATATSAQGAKVTWTATATDSVDSTPAVTCTPTSGSTFAPGVTPVTCTATDAAGNTSAAQTFKVTVSFAWSNLLQPINTDGSSIFKLGSTIPVKFQLSGASAGITNLPAKLFYAKISNSTPGTFTEATSTAAADSGNTFRYDTTAGQYIFNLSTKTWSEGLYQLRVDLGDGVSHTVNITIKK